MIEKEFNLIHEKWIPVMKEDGAIEEVGLEDVLVHAHEYIRISSELPTLDYALMRLLMATAYASNRVWLDGIDDVGSAISSWKQVMDVGRFDESAIRGYLDRYEDRFYLFHPTRPFYQAPIHKGTEYSAAKLIGTLSESSNKPRFFQMVSGDAKESIGYPEAARWLLHVIAYDDTSAKPTVPKSGLPSPGAGWVGKIGPVYFTGDNLFQTLLLNMPFFNMILNEPFTEGVATWEPEVADVSERREIPLPGSPIELLTIQSRRILLKRIDGRVTGFLLLGGDFFQKENAFIEQMTAWHRTKEGGWIPMRHDPSRFIWRDFNPLLLERDEDNNPGVVKWVSRLVSRGIIAKGNVRLTTSAVTYGDKDFVATGVVNDALSLNSQILSDLGKEWRVRISDSLDSTDQCVMAFGRFAQNLAVAEGEDEKSLDLPKLRSVAMEQAYFRLDKPFRVWLSAIDPDSDSEDDRIAEWERQMRSLLFSMADDMVSGCSIKAITGRDMERNAFSRLQFFKNTVNKILR